MQNKEVIAFKIAIVGRNVATHFECGVIDVSMKDLMKYEASPEIGGKPVLHPDLVEAAMASITMMARAYNGVKDGEEQTTDEGQQKANAGDGQETRNADEEARQIAENEGRN